MRVENHANLSASELARIRSEVRGHRTIEDVLKWGFAQQSPAMVRTIIGDVIVQDEFTQDLIVPWREGLVLVYGAT